MSRLPKFRWIRQRKLAQAHRAEFRRRALHPLFAELLEPRMLLTAITSVDPTANSHDAATSTDVSAMFDQNINSATATPQTFAVHSMQRGQLVGSAVSVITSGTTVSAQPATAFFPGELVQATVTADVRSAGGQPAQPHVWQFRTAVAGGTGTFSDSGQVLSGVSEPADVSLGDLDNDGDLDAFVTNFPRSQPSRVWLNDGGVFFDSGQRLGSNRYKLAAALGDLDGDGDLDAFIANGGGSDGNHVWLNNGNAIFSDSGQNIDAAQGEATSVSLGDVDGDGDLDAVTTITYTGNTVWLNDGTGRFQAGQVFPPPFYSHRGAALGDLDGDGDLDVFFARLGEDPENTVWVNDGHGRFSDSGQRLGDGNSWNVVLGDLDNDGDLDAYIDNWRAPDRLWLNDGRGVFSDSGQDLSSFGTTWHGVSLGDLDADNDLDVFVVTSEGDQVWFNNGQGELQDSGQSLANDNGAASALGDLDGDGDLDAFVVNSQVNRVWLNRDAEPTLPSVTLGLDNSTIAEAAGATILTATLSAVSSLSVTVDLEFTGTATAGTDYTNSSSQISIPAGSLSGTATITAVQDLLDEPDETILVDITGIQNGTEAGTQQITIIITDDDVPLVPDVTLVVDNAAIAEAGGVAAFTATLSEVTTVAVTVELEFTGTAAASDYIASATQIVVAPGATSGSATVTAVQDEVNEPDETVIVDISVTGGNEDGVQQQTITIVDDDVPPSFTVTSLDSTASGFRVEFTNEIDASELNLYDTQNAALGAADVVVTGASSGAVAGSLIVDTSAITFIKSGGPLAADSYTVTLRSATDGFKDSAAMLLDGNGDGTGGDDYVGNFTVAEAPGDARTVSIPDFVRGPGQDVNLLADTMTGIPITINDGDNVRAADIRIGYDPALLEITGATAPAGGSVIVNTTTTPGVAILVFFSSASLPAGSTTFINLQATVPTADASANYGLQQMLDVHAVTIGDGNDNEFAVVVDDAHHFATYFADVSGNGRVNASDAAQVARFAALIDAGFAGSLNADPITIGDISGNGRINAADASRVAQFAALIEVPEIPPVPGGIQITGLVNPGLGNVGTIPIIVDPLAGPSQSGNIADSVTSDFRVVENFASKGNETTIIDQVAVDRMMADLANSVNDELGELDSVAALEGTLDELSSAID